MERLDKTIANFRGLTRKEAHTAIRSGRVTVNGSRVSDPAAKVEHGRDAISLDGVPVCNEKHVYIMMNKPAGVLSASRDPHAQTVVDLLPESLYRKGLFPAGRLDKDTVGFVLLTDDGALAHRILSPRSHVPKVYLARLDKPADGEMQKLFAGGIRLADGTECRPAELDILEKAFVRITIREGKYHQIKRMAAASGRTVEWLKRIRIGGVELDETLQEGASRALTGQEVQRLRNF